MTLGLARETPPPSTPPQDGDAHLPLLIPPILTCIADQDSKIRYLACESLYNLAKASRGHVLRYFNEIFDVLSKVRSRAACSHPPPRSALGAWRTDGDGPAHL